MSAFNWRNAAAAGLMIAAASVPSLAIADDDDDRRWWPRWGMGHMMMGGWGTYGPMDSEYPGAMLERIDGRLAFLKAELKITEQQAAAWDEFAGAIRTRADAHNELMRSMRATFDDGDFLKKPLPERLTFQISHLEARVEQAKAVKAAVDKLYATLDDTQKQAADDTVLPLMGMGMGRGGYGPGRR